MEESLGDQHKLQVIQQGNMETSSRKIPKHQLLAACGFIVVFQFGVKNDAIVRSVLFFWGATAI